MADVMETWCRLCHKNITDESFEVIDNSTRDILDVLLLKLEFDNEKKEVICNACRRKLNAALDFRSTCLNTDKTIIPYVDGKKMLQLDLREVYMQEKKSELNCSQKICRLCMHPVESEFRCIREVQLEAIQKLAPEMDINIIKDPVVCKQCLYSLCTHNSFLNDCSKVEERKSIFGSSATGSQIDTSPLDLLVKTENLDKEFDINEMEMSIKPEYVDIKSEDEERSNKPLPDIVPFEESDCKYEEEDGCKRESGSEVKTKQKHKVLYKCDNCIYETESVICFTAHCARHENDSEAYKCESCEYNTKNKTLLQRHLLRHKDPSQVQMYKCEDCDYESKYKGYIKRHQLRHKDPQVQMYKCNDCDYETKHKHVVKIHQLTHKNPSQLQMYKCNHCDFKTKYNKDAKRHQLIHKDPSQIQMYKCNSCTYETKHKRNMKRHELKHKDPSQVQMYRCKDCDYETKYKGYIKQHQLKHKDPQQVWIFSCNDCDYQTEYNKNTVKNTNAQASVRSLHGDPN
ncbi:zinc finger protein 624-like [Anoplophora glabripennis]|uniref:zinc finger protein 624-like n=1 Tax=Anoplophora glabripennis TaxID=217634 RepID=UPI0008735216|nr:zinc finger protein 624-like [Anoplophora glabripennis]